MNYHICSPSSSSLLSPAHHSLSRRRLRHRPPSPLPFPVSSSISFPRRRHPPSDSHLRRKFRFVPPASPQPARNDDSNDVEFSVDIDAAVDRARASALRFYRRLDLPGLLSSGAEAFRDLRTSVRIEDGRRVVFSCRRDSLLFAGNLVVWGFVVAFSAKVLLWLWDGSKSRGVFGNRSVVTRRDRSLGGREVVVETRSTKAASPKWDPLLPGRGNEARKLDGSRTKRSSRRDKLPEWWAEPTDPPYLPSAAKEDAQREANLLVRAMMDNRMNGKDYREDDIIQLRHICRTSGVGVSFDTENARNSFYLAAVDFVLRICSRVSQSIPYAQIDGEDVRKFLAGLANNIGLENIRAARFILAAVAAKTRSWFLQSWALEVQGKRFEALEELLKISIVYHIFTPEENSPEIEMLASGLKRHLKVEQRKHLLNLLEGVCSDEPLKAAASALGFGRSEVYEPPMPS